ncbi:hypothetical protein CANINC_001752 [Pichia inconspicua]|uniref:non-specific serine/threonine protein kinase n=1 Tax=Pichia inconspicua TaxID=52247 RepID=A0A4T0X384_9ASCO|nr:hypothetical protein CANINC_001752 [[Candida] inconspicua]
MSDQFIDLEVIGRGSFGLIKKVQHVKSGRIFVRKEISYRSLSKKEEKQLASEFEILQNLKHPNIVRVYDYEKLPNEKLLNIYMEYCDGGDVSQLIKRHRESKQYINETLIWQIFTQTLLALYRCHYGSEIQPVDILCKSTQEIRPPSGNDQVVIHRDIKPENIFFMSDKYSVKLGDFGLAKSLAPETHFTQTYVGTPYYMPPEVIKEQAYNTLCDVWSLGCVIYELCALIPPFTAKTHTQLQEKIKNGIFPDIPSHFSNRLVMCIKACLVVDPTERADVNQLLQEVCFKIYRKEWELYQKEYEIARKEAELVKYAKSLDDERKKINIQNEEIKRAMVAEYKYVVDSKLQQMIADFPNEIRSLLQCKLREKQTTTSYNQYLNSPSKLKGPQAYEIAEERYKRQLH